MECIYISPLLWDKGFRPVKRFYKFKEVVQKAVEEQELSHYSQSVFSHSLENVI